MILYSNHAREQMVERGISKYEIEEGIAKGAKELQMPDKIRFHYRYYTVVAKKINDDFIVITVMLR